MVKICSALEKRLSAIALVILVIQPALDVLSYFLEQTGSNAISTVARFLMLAAVALLGFLASHRKKLYLLFYGVVGLFWVLHMANCFRIGYVSLFSDAANFLRILNFPIFTLTFITFFQRRDVRKSIYLGFAIDLGEVLLFTALPWLLGHPVYTYETLEVGVLGWFSTPSAQSAVIALLVPMGLLWAIRTRKYPVFLAAALLGFGLMFFTGTKFTFYSIFIVGGAYLFLFALRWKKQFLLYGLTLLVILCAAFLFRHQSPMSVREQLSSNAQGEYSRLVEESLKNSGVDEEEIQKLQEGAGEEEEEEEEKKGPTPTPEERLGNLRRNIIGVYTDREVYGPFFENLHERFGAYRVMDAYNYTVQTNQLSDTRVRKAIYAQLVWEEKDFLTKLLGFEYSDMLAGGSIYDLENDFPAVFYFCGYLGFGLYLLFFAYFAFILLRAFWKKLKAAALASRQQGKLGPPLMWNLQVFWQALRQFLTLEMGGVGMTFLLAIIAAQISGNVLRRPNVTAYFAVAAACVYFLTVELPKGQQPPEETF